MRGMVFFAKMQKENEKPKKKSKKLQFLRFQKKHVLRNCCLQVVDRM